MKRYDDASHTVDHVLLPQADRKIFDYQVTADCKKIGKLCGVDAVGLAYPCGCYNDEAAEHFRNSLCPND